MQSKELTLTTMPNFVCISMICRTQWPLAPLITWLYWNGPFTTTGHMVLNLPCLMARW